MKSPIALFAFLRRDSLEKVVNSLLQNPECEESDLHVFHDGLPTYGDTGVQEQRAIAHQNVERYISTIEGFRSIKIWHAVSNLGLARSIISGVSDICSSYDRVIVVEDDLVVAPEFLRYMNAGLDRYVDDERVASIHGYFYPGASSRRLPPTFFLRGADCWGWGTWARAWKEFNSNGRELLQRLRRENLLDAFRPGDHGPYEKMLEDCIENRVDSWAIRWHASMFLNGRLTLYPRRSLVRNIGFDQFATHTGARATRALTVRKFGRFSNQWPSAVAEDAVGRAALWKYFNHSHARNRWLSVLRRGLSFVIRGLRKALGIRRGGKSSERA